MLFWAGVNVLMGSLSVTGRPPPEAPGFASPPHDGFAFVGRIPDSLSTVGERAWSPQPIGVSRNTCQSRRRPIRCVDGVSGFKTGPCWPRGEPKGTHDATAR